MTRLIFTLSLSLTITAAVACGDDGGEPAADATVELTPLGGSGVQGTVSFTILPEGKVRIDAEITGLTTGMHGMHIHEWGDCSAADGMSAGGHFNPDAVDHGAPDAATHHPGDFGNIEADASGRAVVSRTMDTATLSIGSGGKYDIVGRAIIVHADPDDLMTQPTGNAGGRLACGVIEAADGPTTPVLMPAGA